MKNLFLYPLCFFILCCCRGCSVQHIYIIRNSAASAAEIILTMQRSGDSSKRPDLEIRSTPQIVALKKSNIRTAFVGKVAGSWSESGACQFVLPPGHSVDITSLIEALGGYRNNADFNGLKLEINYGKSAIIFGNNLAELHRIFKFKSFFGGGPMVYYLDLE